MAKTYIPKCTARTPHGRCQNRRDARGRFGSYCYQHRNYSAEYIKSGGDRARTRQLKRRFGGVMRWRKFLRQGRGAEFHPYAAAGEVYSETLEVGQKLGQRLGYVLNKLEDDSDTTPAAVRAQAEERFDRVGKLLYQSGVDFKNIGYMSLRGLRVTPFSGTMGVKGRETEHPDIEHDVILVREPRGKGQNREVIIAIDPNVAMFAPVRKGEEEKPLDPIDFPAGKTPFDEGVYITRADSYLNSSNMKWNSYKQVWLDE